MISTASAVLVLGLIATCWARSLTVEKVSVTLTENLEDTETAVNSVIEHVLGGGNSQNALSFLPKLTGCVAPKCCVTNGSYTVCFQASLNGKIIHLVLTVNDQPFIVVDISTPKPQPKCVRVDQGPIKSVCAQVTDLDLSKFYGCVQLIIVMDVQNTTVPIGCFQLGSGNVVPALNHPAGEVLKYLPLVPSRKEENEP